MAVPRPVGLMYRRFFSSPALMGIRPRTGKGEYGEGRVRHLALTPDYAHSDRTVSVKQVEFNEGLHKRAGVIALKLGMVPLWDEWGVKHASTVMMIDECDVVARKTDEKDGYWALQIGSGLAKTKNVGASLLGQFKKAGVPPKRILREFPVHPDGMLPVGFRFDARHFVPGQLVDVSGVTKGKGFSGAMKRWGFKGQPASHGNSKTHRHIGSTGQCQDPGKRFKGKKMAGRMGNKLRMEECLRVLRIDVEKNLLFVKGHVPGNRGGAVFIRDALRRPTFPTPPPFPSFLPGDENKDSPSTLIAPPMSDFDPFLVDDTRDN